MGTERTVQHRDLPGSVPLPDDPAYQTCILCGGDPDVYMVPTVRGLASPAVRLPLCRSCGQAVRRVVHVPLFDALVRDMCKRLLERLDSDNTGGGDDGERGERS